MTCSADCGLASLAATSEPAGAGWDHTEPTAGNRLSRLLLSAGFTFPFSFFSSLFRTTDSTLLDTGVFLAVATHGSLFAFFPFAMRRKKYIKDLRLISLGHE